MEKNYSGNIISSHDVRELISAGYRAFDPHLHTSASYEVLPVKATNPQELFNKMDKAGFGYITFTDHDTLSAYDALQPSDKLVKGVEIKIMPEQVNGSRETHTLHVNVYLLNSRQFEDLEGLAKKRDFYGFIDYLRKADLPFTLNHPTWTEMGETAAWKTLPDIIKEFDVIEVYNQGRTDRQNNVALKLAEKFKKGIVASSDNHQGNPQMSTLVRGSTFRESWDYIKRGEALIVPQNMTAKFLVEEANNWISQWWEASHHDLKAKQYHMGFGHASADRVLEHMVNSSFLHLWPVKAMKVGLLKSIVNTMGSKIANKAYILPQQNKAEAILAEAYV